MGIRRSYFTLIELFLSIGLIAFIGSLVLVRAKPMLDHYRMSHSYEKLKQEIALSKHLAQIATADIEFQIEQQGKGLVCKRKTDEPLCLEGTINTSFVIPYLQLEGSKSETILITSSGWVKNDAIINIYLGRQRKTIDAQSILD